MNLFYRYKKSLFYSYTIILVLISVLPINGPDSEFAINNIYIISIRLDYFLHCAIFIPWVFLLWIFIPFNFKVAPLKTFALLFIGVLIAFAMKAVQYVLPYRAFNINDLLANGLGVMLGFIMLMLGVLKSFGNKRLIGEN